MDEIQLLREYADRSTPSSDINIDVTVRVLHSLRSPREDRSAIFAIRPLAAVAAAGWAAVLATGIFALDAWSSLQDPLASLVSPFVVALQ